MTASLESVMTRAADIRLLILDVDGVLTDGRLYFTARGEEMKCFHVRDGAGVVQLQRTGIHVGLISGRKSDAVQRRAEELGIQYVRQGVENKLVALQEILSQINIANTAFACIGDDTVDIPIMREARLAIAVADAHASVKAVAHFTTEAPGGRGAVREACDLILAAQRDKSAA